jgi:hypothetical protein
MKNIIMTFGAALLVAFAADSARAYHGAGTNLGFMPFGFYQPYGIRYSTSVRTPPYFALNPPVYYGTRYARPYGASPFASPPLLSAPADYRARAVTQFVTPVPVAIGLEHCNPYCSDVLPVGPAGHDLHLHDGGTEGGQDGPSADAAAEPLPEELPEGDTVHWQSPAAGSSDWVVGPVRYNPFAILDGVAAEPRQRTVAR